MALCYVCKDDRVPANSEFEGKPVHDWHLSEFNLTAAQHRPLVPEVSDSLIDRANAWYAARSEGKPESRKARKPETENEEGKMAERKRIDVDQVAELHGQGLSDREMGEKLGFAAVSVAHVRKTLGLESNGRRGRSPKAATPPMRKPRKILQADPVELLKPSEVETLGVPIVAQALLPEQTQPGVAVPPDGHAELRVVMFEFKGSSASADKAFEAIREALAR